MNSEKTTPGQTVRRLLALGGVALLVVVLGTLGRKSKVTSESGPASQSASGGTDINRAARGTSLTNTNAVTALVGAPTNRPAGSHAALRADSGGPGNAALSRRDWDAGFLDRQIGAKPGSVIQIELTGGKMAAGIVESIKIHNEHVTYIDGVLTAPAGGRFFFQDLGARGLKSGLAGVVTFSDNRLGYQLQQAEDGTMTLLELPQDQVICVNYAKPPENLVAEIPPLNPSDAPDYLVPEYQEGIVSLQSLPGAPGVLYMDFRGGHTEGEGWGTFDFEKPNVSNAQIKDVWKRVAEDYLPFTINVTTDIKVYQAAAANSKARCIMTPTTTAAPGAGGVAFVGSWGGGVCWAFYTSGKAAAEVVSHEVGHTLGLGHDGRITPDEGYYGGQGSGATGWAPIMGVGYYQPVAQWSKGEYNSANNTRTIWPSSAVRRMPGIAAMTPETRSRPRVIWRLTPGIPFRRKAWWNALATPMRFNLLRPAGWFRCRPIP